MSGRLRSCLPARSTQLLPIDNRAAGHARARWSLFGCYPLRSASLPHQEFQLYTIGFLCQDPVDAKFPASLRRPYPFAFAVFSCLGVPLVSAATPHLAQRFRSIIDAFPIVNTLCGNWSTNFLIGLPGLVFSLVNPLLAAYRPLESLSYPLLTPLFVNFLIPVPPTCSMLVLCHPPSAVGGTFFATRRRNNKKVRRTSESATHRDQIKNAPGRHPGAF